MRLRLRALRWLARATDGTGRRRGVARAGGRRRRLGGLLALLSPLRPRVHPFGRRWVSVLPLAAILLAAALAAILVVSCVQNTGNQTPPWRGVSATQNSSIIRVRLTPQNVESLAVGTTGAYVIRVDGRDVSRGDGGMPMTRVRRLPGRVWEFNNVVAHGDRAEIITVGNSQIQLDQARYRGTMRLVGGADSTFIAVNCVDLETYLAGVLAKELVPGWSPQTYRALAVAARTFARYQMDDFGGSHEYDLGADQGSQVYGGVAAETAKSWAAVDQTRGQVLVCGPAAQPRVLYAQYSACCGGTVNGAGVIRNAGDEEPYRGGQKCDDCRASQRYRWPPVRISKAEIYSALMGSYAQTASLGSVSEIRVASSTPYGRAVWLDILGPAGQSMRIRAEDLRVALIRSGNYSSRSGLYSMNCSLRDLGDRIEFYDGKGFGHGVGLCQWGAEGKAKLGWSAEQILAFYYPGARIVRM